MQKIGYLPVRAATMKGILRHPCKSGGLLHAALRDVRACEQKIDSDGRVQSIGHELLLCHPNVSLENTGNIEQTSHAIFFSPTQDFAYHRWRIAACIDIGKHQPRQGG